MPLLVSFCFLLIYSLTSSCILKYCCALPSVDLGFKSVGAKYHYIVLNLYILKEIQLVILFLLYNHFHVVVSSIVSWSFSEQRDTADLFSTTLLCPTNEVMY